MTASRSSDAPLVEVGRYPRLSDAREYALVLEARDLPYAIERESDTWVLRVEAPAQAAAVQELASFAAEQQSRRAPSTAREIPKLRTLPLFVILWTMIGLYFLQAVMGPGWTEAGASSSDFILQRGEWWRTVTALTLHSDVSHLAANIATGLLFAASLVPALGAGITALLLVVCGALGNLINAWGYRGDPHASIGASTAVFSALGILVGLELIARWSRQESRNRWHLVVPIGAGLALVAFLGVGEATSRVDFMAHWWGFCVGLVAGVAAGLLSLDRAPRKRVQMIAGTAAALLLAGSWWLAVRS